MNQLVTKLAIKGAKLHPYKMCKGCVCKEGTEANKCSTTVSDVMECVITDNMDFYCHENTSRKCGGYENIKNLEK